MNSSLAQQEIKIAHKGKAQIQENKQGSIQKTELSISAGIHQCPWWEGNAAMLHFPKNHFNYAILSRQISVPTRALEGISRPL